MIRSMLLWLAAVLAAATPARAQKLDTTPRTVVMTAFEPEWNALVHTVNVPVEHRINGVTLVTGTMAGKPVLLLQSGVSMVNAAMNSQLVIDRFVVKRIVFSGIAGGVDPALSIGDVIVPAQWGQYLEVSFARQKPAKRGEPEAWLPPEPVDAAAPPNYGMMFPRGVRVGSESEPARRHYVFAADPALLDLASKVAGAVTLRRCIAGVTAAPAAPVAAPAAPSTAPPGCLRDLPRVVVGGTGVSAGVFADNAAFRSYLFTAWQARVLDMESAAVAQVAYANGVPAIAFRSLSDLAGGDAGNNQMRTFMTLAASNSADVVRAFVAELPD
jgi:adenosylhomocysteine nucleosidase